VSRPRSPLHVSPTLDDAGIVEPPLNIPDIASSARLASAADCPRIYARDFWDGTLAVYYKRFCFCQKHHPTVNDPVFFDSDFDTPQEIGEEKIDKVVIEALITRNAEVDAQNRLWRPQPTRCFLNWPDAVHCFAFS
jgi:hypothetical protein